MSIKRQITVILASVLFAYALAAPADFKDNDFDANEVLDPKNNVKKQVSAQWGGYQASAGLGGGASGGGLYASAGTSAGAGAHAGTGGVAGAGYIAQGGAGSGQGFFDRIFAIPINVLHSVNGYVKTRGTGVRTEYAVAEKGGLAAGASAGVGSGVGASAGVGIPQEGARFGAIAESQVGHRRPYKGDEHYDRVFDIPISALRSVNDFLNG